MCRKCSFFAQSERGSGSKKSFAQVQGPQTVILTVILRRRQPQRGRARRRTPKLHPGWGGAMVDSPLPARVSTWGFFDRPTLLRRYRDEAAPAAQDDRWMGAARVGQPGGRDMPLPSRTLTTNALSLPSRESPSVLPTRGDAYVGSARTNAAAMKTPRAYFRMLCMNSPSAEHGRTCSGRALYIGVFRRR